MINSIVLVERAKKDNEIEIDQVKDVAPSSLLSLDLKDRLDYIPKRELFLKECIARLRYDGTIQFTGVDLSEVARSIYVGIITIEEAQDMLYNQKVSTSSIFKMKEFLQQEGLEIMDCRLDQVRYFIKAKRVKK